MASMSSLVGADRAGGAGEGDVWSGDGCGRSWVSWTRVVERGIRTEGEDMGVTGEKKKGGCAHVHECSTATKTGCTLRATSTSDVIPLL